MIELTLKPAQLSPDEPVMQEQAISEKNADSSRGIFSIESYNGTLTGACFSGLKSVGVVDAIDGYYNPDGAVSIFEFRGSTYRLTVQRVGDHV